MHYKLAASSCFIGMLIGVILESLMPGPISLTVMLITGIGTTYLIGR